MCAILQRSGDDRDDVVGTLRRRAALVGLEPQPLDLMPARLSRVHFHLAASLGPVAVHGQGSPLEGLIDERWHRAAVAATLPADVPTTRFADVAGAQEAVTDLAAEMIERELGTAPSELSIRLARCRVPWNWPSTRKWGRTGRPAAGWPAWACTSIGTTRRTSSTRATWARGRGSSRRASPASPSGRRFTSSGPCRSTGSSGWCVWRTRPRERVDQAMLALRESGAYYRLHRKWFGGED